MLQNHPLTSYSSTVPEANEHVTFSSLLPALTPMQSPRPLSVKHAPRVAIPPPIFVAVRHVGALQLT